MLFLVIGLLITAVFKTTAALPGKESENMKPVWVLQRPKSEGYFVGIGGARRVADLPGSRDRALKHALNDIATQIEADIFSEVFLKEAEDADQVRKEYSTEIRTMVSATLEGVEIVDTWEDAENCWAYVRLDIARFERRRQASLEKARQSAFCLFSKAGELEAAGAMAEALSLYLQALKPLRDALGDPLPVNHRGRSLALDAEIPLRIQAVLSSIHLEATPVESPLKQGMLIDVPLEVVAQFKDGQGVAHRVSGLPIEFTFERGRGDLIDRMWTGEDGVAMSRLHQVHAPNLVQAIRARIDLASFFFQDPRDVAACRQLVSFAVPSATFHLNILPQRVHILSRESNLGRALPVLCLEPVIKQELGKVGLNFVDCPEQADLIIEIHVRTREGSRFQGLHFSFLDMTLSVRSGSLGEERFKTSLSNVKGGGTSFAQAGIKAFEKAGEHLKERVLPELLEELNR